MGALVQAIVLLVQVFPSALKAIQAWKDYHGAELNRERRAQLAGDVRNLVATAIESKDTAGLEDAIKNLGRPINPATQDPKSPS